MSRVELVRLTSPWIVWPALAVALVTIALTARQWRRTGRGGRTGWVVGATLATVAALALVIDQTGSFYPTIGSLLAISRTSPAPTVTGPPALAGHATRAGRLAKLDGIRVYLPAGYDEAPADLRYPVVDWRAGRTDPGLAAQLDAAIAARRLPPVVVVFHQDNAELRGWAAERYRVRTDDRAWLRVDPGGTAPPGGTGRVLATAAGPDTATTLAWLGANLPDPIRIPAGAGR